MGTFWANWCSACDSFADFIIPNLPYAIMLSFTLAFPIALISTIRNCGRRKK